MREKITMKPLAAAIGTAMAASLMSIPAANADENPFSMTELSSGYMVAGGDKGEEGKCGEGKCGGAKGGGGDKGEEGKCGEGKCGGAKGDEEKGGEGKCGEGKCGSKK